MCLCFSDLLSQCFDFASIDSNNVQLTDIIIVFSWIKNDYLQSLIYPFISPNFVPKNGTVQLMICSTPSIKRKMPRLF